MNFSVFPLPNENIFLGEAPRIIEICDPIVAAAIGREKEKHEKSSREIKKN